MLTYLIYPLYVYVFTLYDDLSAREDLKVKIDGERERERETKYVT